MKTLPLFLLISSFLLFLQCRTSPTLNEFPIILQQDVTECGPVCLKMIAQYYDKEVSLEKLNRISQKSDATGTSMLGLSKAAEAIGLKTLGTKITYERLADDIPLPAIIHWKENHFVVVYKINEEKAWIADPNPEVGKTIYSKIDFCENWYKKTHENEGVILLLEPTDKF